MATEFAKGDLRYKRNDLTVVGMVSRGCLVVYPPAKKSRQRVAVGDASGVATVFSIGKVHDVVTAFTTPKLPHPISKLCLFETQLFTMNGPRLNAYTKKGKSFFSFDSNMTEIIHSFAVETPYIYCGGEYVLTSFQEAKELGFYMAPDRINDLLISPVDGSTGSRCNVYLACQDRVLRTVTDNKAHFESNCEGPLTALTYFTRSDVKDEKGRAVRDIVYGTSAGSLGAYTFTVGSSRDPVRRYTAIPEQRQASVTGVYAAHNASGDNATDIAVARDDGSVELHSFGLVEGKDGPLPAWRSSIDEMVTGIAVGAFTGTEANEIIVSSYTGKIISFSYDEEDAKMAAVVPNVMQGKLNLSQPPAPAKVDKKNTNDQERQAAQEVLAAKIKEVENDIAQMKQGLENRRKEYEAAISSNNNNKSNHPKQLLAVTSEFHVRTKWELNGHAALCLMIEVDAALDHVALQSDTKLELFDDFGNNNNEKDNVGNLVVSMGSPQLTVAKNPGPSKTLCVIRPADPSATRIEVYFRPMEGTPGTLHVFVTPRVTPRTCQLKTFTIHALCLHQRINSNEVDWEKLPLTSLKMTGAFTAHDAHAWVYAILPDVPEMMNQEKGSLAFRNTFVGSALFISYSKGEAEFKSDNMTTLAILKENITKEATRRKIAIKLSSDLHPDTMNRTLRLLHPLVGAQLRLASQLKLLEALKEIEAQEEDTSFLSDAHREILAHSSELQKDMEKQPQRTEYLKALIMRLYSDRAMFKGEVVPQNKIKELEGVLENYNDAEVDNFFAKN